MSEYVETQAFEAVLNHNIDEAERLLEESYPSELVTLINACVRLSNLAALLLPSASTRRRNDAEKREKAVQELTRESERVRFIR